MPKLFNVLIGVEESALGPVMRVLGRTPGIAKFDVLPDDAMTKRHANGHVKHSNGEEKPRKGRKISDVTGADFLLKTLAKHKGSMKHGAIKEAFGKDGRAPGSAVSVIHLAKVGGLIQNVARGEGYALTKKGRDKSRYV